ncbi:hypothetical protein PVAND_011068 [Polypedilum vanderplanki]|uniref:Neurabin-1 n=1 Tax=Polypedilum vanderplanki TaxID=319348 RepID=A0A9J6CJA7_POLVA|nr:hypothetical protein PVAND_011068 [Polypedilum vanderplanki]
MKIRKSRSQDDDEDADDEKVQRRSKKVSSICINLPAAGLGQRPPSIHSSVTTDEGGFNEPSPEIKALQTVYDYDKKSELISSHPDVISNVTYVDLEHRVQPEGIESDQLYDENESYRRKIENGNEVIKEKVVYATIKPELPVMMPARELIYEKENILDEDGEYDVKVSQDITDRSYISPQKILDPTCTRLHEDKDIEELFNKKLPPEPLSEAEETEEEHEHAPTLPVKKIPPPVPELNSPLDLQDVEFADASDTEDEVNNRKISEDNESIIPDAMTQDEAERLLSSRILESKIRQQSLLSDEQAREVEAILANKELPPLPKEPSRKRSDTSENEPDWLQDVLTANTNTTKSEFPNNANDKSSTDQTNDMLNQTILLGDSSSNAMLQDSLVSVESNQSANESINTITNTTTSDSINFSKVESRRDNSIRSSATSLAENEDSGDESLKMEYPPVKSQEVFVNQDGVHFYEDGNFWMEVPGLLENDREDDEEQHIPVKKNTKVKFSTAPIQVFSTFSVNDYDRRNEDVDPVAASAEYELEKRVEKMDVFPVQLMKGNEGLGLSIIGMGVGADSGLEKLGIFVKTITENGAASRDGRIQVNDQIIEVDGKSLVGVTQAYAASVLRNTSGLVKFQIGREKDPENSEVAQLIRQSLQADREKEERMRRQQEEYLRRTSEDSTLPVSANSSLSEGPLSPTQIIADSPFEGDYVHSNSNSSDVESLKRILQELIRYQSVSNETEILNEKLKQTERDLADIRKEANNYQNMLQQSQAQYTTLERKYSKIKKMLRDFQQRDRDMIQFQEYYLQHLQEKDTEYNALVKKLKDRVICLEQELQDTQKRAGLPVCLPYDSTSLKLTPQMTRKQPPKQLPFQKKIEGEYSDLEISDLSPDGEGEDGKTATVERKIPVKDEFDTAIPKHELLDSSVNKAKSDLVSRGALANRQLPKKLGNSNSSSNGTLDLDESEEEQNIDAANNNPTFTNGVHYSTPIVNKPVVTPSVTALYASVHKEKDRNDATSPVQAFNMKQQQHTTIPNIFRDNNISSGGGAKITSTSYGSDLNASSYESDMGSSNDKLDDQSPDTWIYPSRRPKGLKGINPPSLNEQLKERLAEREGKKMMEDGSSRDSSDDFTDLNHTQNPAERISQNLLCEIKKAVNENVGKGSSPPWKHQTQSSDDNLSASSDSSPAYSPSRTLDISGSSTSFSSDRAKIAISHQWKSGPVEQWNNEQVCHWLLGINMEQHVPKFIEHVVEGGALLQLDSRDFKILNVSGDDKKILKKNIKELKRLNEKERRQTEKDRKEREKMIKKAEKKAEKEKKKK